VRVITWNGGLSIQAPSLAEIPGTKSSPREDLKKDGATGAEGAVKILRILKSVMRVLVTHVKYVGWKKTKKKTNPKDERGIRLEKNKGGNCHFYRRQRRIGDRTLDSRDPREPEKYGAYRKNFLDHDQGCYCRLDFVQRASSNRRRVREK